MKKIDAKLANIRAGKYTRADFMIADAKDADMGGGIGMGGPRRRPDGSVDGVRSRREYLDAIKAVVAQDIVDIMLVSASNLEVLTQEGVFARSAIQPAVRANEATDIWGGLRHGRYASRLSVPFRSAVLGRVMYGNADGSEIVGTDLGLYSMTFNNDLAADLRTLEAFKEFRDEAGALGFRYFLEVFNPNAPADLDRTMIPSFVNDHIVRSLAGVMQADRPQFLKIPYNGPGALEELAAFDPTLVVGVLGGSAGTTRDTFELIYQAERHGGRLALFGRKINLAESPLALIKLMRAVADGTLAPAEAVRVYHGALQAEGIRPERTLEEDVQITEAPLMLDRSPDLVHH
ncbi:MAG: hypothetical protein ABSB70_06455 [Candidatus Velthaea sp.]